MVHAAKAMAATALDCLRDPALLASAKADFAQRTKTFAYKSPLPADTKPPVDRSGCRMTSADSTSRPEAAA